MKSFDVAISLGLFCEVRANIINNIYDGDMFWDMDDPLQGAFYFDWLSSSSEGLLYTLRTQFAHNHQLENLIPVSNPYAKDIQVQDSLTQIEYPHHFIVPPEGLTPHSIATQYDNVKSKLDYLASKTLSIMTSNCRILYVYSGQVSAQYLKQLLDILDSITTNYILLYVGWKNVPYFEDLTFMFKSDSRVLIRYVNKQEYPGDSINWKKAFVGLNVIGQKFQKS